MNGYGSGGQPTSVELAEAFLAEKHSILWGKAWDIQTQHSRHEAAQWLVSVFAEFEGFLDRCER